ncbi:YdeI/OmpD-associated family protein [Ilumatobacter sp.]|uniref:YdeI/OmpD-associated family protein n=1 Tax=Ilumatobacter sp. TaxID=1967498 RepID=UPI003AF486F8
MPADVRASLVDRGVLDDYRSRPAYQRNDYLGWIGGAKRPETRRRRIEQMLDELERGGVYMKMEHPPSRR